MVASYIFMSHKSNALLTQVSEITQFQSTLPESSEYFRLEHSRRIDGDFKRFRKGDFMMRTYLKTALFRYPPSFFLLAVLILLSTVMLQACLQRARLEGEPDKAEFAVLDGYWESAKQGERCVYKAEGSNFFIVNSSYEGLYGTLSGELDSMTFRFAEEYVVSLADSRATAEVQKQFRDYLLGTSERIVFTQSDVNGTQQDALDIYGRNGSLVDHAFRIDEATAKARIEKLQISN